MHNHMKRSPAGSRLLDFLDTMRAGFVKWQSEQIGDSLPWGVPKARGLTGTVSGFTENVVQNIPGIGDAWRQWCGEGVKAHDQSRDPMQMLLAVGGAVAALVAVGGTLLFRSLPPFGAPTQKFEPQRHHKAGLYQFGDLGAMFDSLPELEVKPRSSQHHTGTVYKTDDV